MGLFSTPIVGHFSVLIDSNDGMQDIKPFSIQCYLSDAIKSGRIKRVTKTGKVIEGGLSSTTVKQHYAVLRIGFKRAVRWGVIKSNPVEFVDCPKAARVEKEAYTSEEVKTLLTWSKGKSCEPIILLAMATGCRLGELMALKWDDVDEDNSCIFVSKAANSTKATDLRVKTTKSYSGIRTIAIGKKAMARLMDYKKRQQARAEELGSLWIDNNLICPSDNGGQRNPDTVSSCFRDWAKAAKVRSLGLHALRHTEISYLAKKGCDIKTNQKRSGHSTAKMMLDVYVHVPDSSNYQAAEMLDDLF